MSALSFVRMARRVVGMAPQAAFPNLESLLETEAAEMHNDYRTLSFVAPGFVTAGGLFGVVAQTIHGHVLALFALPLVAAAAVASWFFLDRLDRTIPPARKRIRKLAEPIWGRYQSVLSVTNVEPAISPLVAAVLDDASVIYLKRCKSDRKQFGDSYSRGVDALEEAMARLLTLAEPKTVSAQEMEYLAGWAQPLLEEMQEMDRVLDRHSLVASSSDPLIGLREARLEIQGIESALRELEQHQ